MTVKFSLGQTVITPGALDSILSSGGNPSAYLDRHLSGDWGELSAEDVAENELSVREGFRILSAYLLPDGVRIWIITEWDRSSTCILLPEEY